MTQPDPVTEPTQQPTQQPIGIHRGGPPETVLQPAPPEAIAALQEATGQAAPGHEATAQAAADTAKLAQVAQSWPRVMEVWAELGKASLAAGELTAAYAYFRVGYHRGLDALRAQGWRGSGYVRWQHPTNHGFLRCVSGLQQCAQAISETDEAQRCAQFLAQLDPSGAPAGE